MHQPRPAADASAGARTVHHGRFHAGEIPDPAKGPTPPRPALAEGFSTWRLISQLQMNYLSLMDSENEEGAAALRQLLGLYANLAETPVARQVEGVRHCVLEPVHRRVRSRGRWSLRAGSALL